MPLQSPHNIYIFAIIMIFLSRLSLHHALQSSSLREVSHNRRLYTTRSSSLKSKSSRLSTMNTRCSHYTLPQEQASSSLFSTSSSSSSSSFEAPEPPAFNGQPIFPNVDLTQNNLNSQGYKRNEDPNSIFVVTGASRGRFHIMFIQHCSNVLFIYPIHRQYLTI